jgi:OPT family oligopeptide transporter
LKDERDIHSRLMRSYSEVPAWWYGAVGISSFSLLIIAIHIFPTQLPIWAASLAFFLATISSVPLAMLQAITNQEIPIQVLHELLAGYILPELPTANIIFKVVGSTCTKQAINFAGYLKLGHYMKIPPRTMFSIQMIAVVVNGIVVVSVQDWMFANIVDFCSPSQKDGFVCPDTTVFETASLIWGGIGPARLFSPGKMQVFLQLSHH